MRAILLVLGIVAIAVVAVLGALGASLPDLDGTAVAPGLGAPVTIERDRLGVPTVHAPDRDAAAFATGYLHAQDRFFQMDLLRRDAAGELAALVGAGAVAHDEARRLHRLRRVAREVVAREEAPERALLRGYTRGVNAGIDALALPPFEYLVLRARPAPWREEDTMLAVFAMYLQLNDEDGRRDAVIGALHAALTPEMFDFVVQPGTRWDAPLRGAPQATRPVPGPGACDLREASLPPPEALAVSDASGEADAVVGSNAWAVSGRHTASGNALLANDMHLGLRVPNVWYRIRILVEAADGTVQTDVIGASLPGTPAVVVGSNRHVAWGFTNSYGDWTDRVRVEIDPADPDRYRTPEGTLPFDVAEEVIEVRGGADRTLTIRGTRWGPIAGAGPDGEPVAVRWLAHRPAATNLRLVRMEDARDVRAATAVAQRAGVPPQNFVAADTAGDIAWTIAGRIPLRSGYEPMLPADGSSPGGWTGWLAPADYPLVVTPPSGRIWTANARVVDGEWLALLGDGGYALGARAAQIRDDLLAVDAATERDMLDVQLDDRARFVQSWRPLLLQTLSLDAAAADAGLAAVARVVESWDGRALPDSSGYRLVRAFRAAVHESVLRGIAFGCARLAPGFAFERMPQLEGTVWALVEARPPHLLPPRYESWDALLVEAAQTALASCGSGGAAGCPWGDVNPTAVRHPLSRVVPALGWFLDMPVRALPGGTWVPRVNRTGNGASERFAVSPGREASGYFHMPGGQSGHPLSAFYRAGFDAWATGEPLPFLPGPARHRLVLRPPAGG